MAERQSGVMYPSDGLDDALATFVADVLELAGRFEELADDIARKEGETRARWYVLSVFSGDPLTVSRAARRLGTTRQAVQRSVDQLIERGLLTAGPNPDHRSSPLITLTKPGLALLRRISDRAVEERRHRLPHATVRDLRAGHSAVRKVLAVFNDKAEVSSS